MAWKGEDSEVGIDMRSSSVKWAQWLRVARNFQLRIGLKDTKESFDGFMREVSSNLTNSFWSIHFVPPQDHDKLAGLLKQHFSITLETKEISFKGWNWGQTDFQGQIGLFFLVG
jgi:structure-specific recognition protein 1